MIKPEVKKEISDFIQELLQDISDSELPDGEIPFILHIDGKGSWSWANIRNTSDRHKPAPLAIQKNLKKGV